MNRIDQVATQNLQDCWSILYKNLAKSVLQVRGKDGEVVIRRANHLCGERMGALELKNHREAGKLTNLQTYFTTPVSRCIDPRFRFQWQLFNEQEAVFDVITCPIYDYLLKTGAKDLMISFCEEYHHGCIMAYTGKAGQCTFSENFVYMGENSCRFGCYYRPANIPAAERPASFSADRAEEAQRPDPYIPCPDPKGAFALWGELLLTCYMEEMTARYGEGSVCALSEGLKAAAHETIPYLKQRSISLRKPLDEAFLAEHTFWGTRYENRFALAEGAAKMVEINYCRTLKADLASCQ